MVKGHYFSSSPVGLVIFMLLLSLLGACNTYDPLTSTPTEGLLNEVQFIELTPDLSTILHEDSILTGGDDLLLVGQHDSPIFGRITAETYANTAHFLSAIVSQEAIFDSVVVVLDIVYHYGADVAEVPIEIVLLEDRVRLDTLHLSTHTLPIKSEPGEEFLIAKQNLSFDASRDTAFTFHAEQAWAKDFFKRLIDEDIDNFFTTFEGIVIRTPADATPTDVILGFNPLETVITLYYHEPIDSTEEPDEDEDDPDPGARFKRMRITSSRFNHISVDRAGSRLADIEPNTPFTDNGVAYAQGGTGLFFRVHLEDFYDFYQKENAPLIYVAELRLGPVEALSAAGQTFDLPSSVSMHLPNSDPLRNTWRYLNNSLVRNEGSLVSAQNSVFFNVVAGDSTMFKGSITLGLQRILLDRGSESVWVGVSSDNNGLEPLRLKKGDLRLRIYYGS